MKKDKVIIRVRTFQIEKGRVKMTGKEWVRESERKEKRVGMKSKVWKKEKG